MSFLLMIMLVTFLAVAIATTLVIVGIVKKKKGFLITGVGLYLLYIIGYFALQYLVTSM